MIAPNSSTPGRLRRWSFLPLVALCVAAIGLGFAAGCQSRISDRDLVRVDVDEAVRAMEGERRLFARTRTVWVDARSADEYSEGHIPEAIHMPLDRARQDHGMLREYDTIIVYGRDRGSPRADALSKLLMELRHRDVRTLQGGFAAWKSAGQPVEAGQ